MQGLVKAIGVSNYGPKQLVRIHKYLQRRGVPLSSVQVTLNPKMIKIVCDKPYKIGKLSFMGKS
jgi:diketogulonate reductase-like aldo/keto reductase